MWDPPVCIPPPEEKGKKFRLGKEQWNRKNNTHQRVLYFYYRFPHTASDFLGAITKAFLHVFTVGWRKSVFNFFFSPPFPVLIFPPPHGDER